MSELSDHIDAVTSERDALRADRDRLARSKEALIRKLKQTQDRLAVVAGALPENDIRRFYFDKATALDAAEASRDRLAALVEIERTANKVTENHNHFDCAAAMAQKDIEIARLADLRDELQASLRVQAEDHAHRLAALVEKLRPYLRHDSFCPAAEGQLAAPTGPCDCQLAGLLAEMPKGEQ